MVHQWLTNDHVPRNESYVAFQLTPAHHDLSTRYGIYYGASGFFIDEKDGERYHYPDVAQWKYSKMKIKKNPRNDINKRAHNWEAYRDALVLAITAPTDAQSNRAAKLAEYFALTMTVKEQEQAKRYAEKIVKRKTGSNPRIKKNPEIHIDIGSHNATRSKRVRTNPKQPAARDLDQAKKLFRGFTGKEPQGVTRLKIKPFSTGLAIGKILGIIYEVSATGEKLKHSFKDSARPHLIVSSDGHQVLICGGKFTFTSRGFVDK